MVIWSQPAKTDLRAIHDYIAHNSRYYAKKVTQDIEGKLISWRDYPRPGARCRNSMMSM